MQAPRVNSPQAAEAAAWSCESSMEEVTSLDVTCTRPTNLLGSRMSTTEKGVWRAPWGLQLWVLVSLWRPGGSSPGGLCCDSVVAAGESALASAAEELLEVVEVVSLSWVDRALAALLHVALLLAEAQCLRELAVSLETTG